MTAVTAPGARRSLLGQLLAAVAIAVPRFRKQIAAVVPVIREHMTDVAAFAAIDFGGFTAWHHGGWIVLGFSLLLLNFKIKG